MNLLYCTESFCSLFEALHRAAESCDLTSAHLLFQTSIPAVSSSHGSLLAVVPGVLGLMAFSPELDACGNPWRAVHFCQVSSSLVPLPVAKIREGGQMLCPTDRTGPWGSVCMMIRWHLGVFLCLQELISTFQLHSFDIRTPFRQILAYRQWKAESEVGSAPLFGSESVHTLSLTVTPLQGYQIMNVLLAAFKGDVQALRR